MKKIKLLESSLINKIAAGEVVERPGAVVKELLENSIDAGATMITVEIKDGGKTLIRITDNGSGIAKEDLKLAFMRHSTSKIGTLSELEGVLTFGFRGEALSSICAVSQLEMVTKTRQDSTGTRIEIHGGEYIDEQDVASVEGTTIIVRNLFYNTPARRKFLKKTSTESAYITDIVQKAALGSPGVAIKYINSSSVALQTNGNGDLKTVMYHVYGRETANKVIPLEYKCKMFTLNGFIGKPELYKANRSCGNFFINGRYIKSNIVRSAVEDAYKTKMLVGKFPVYVFNLEIDPTEVDVNVHPSKLEVRFSKEDTIYNHVYQAISNALNSISLIPSVQLGQKIRKRNDSDLDFKNPEIVQGETTKNKREPLQLRESSSVYNKSKDSGISAHEFALQYGFKPEKQRSDQINLEDMRKNESIVHVDENNSETLKINDNKEKFFKQYKIIGQIFRTYWIIEQNNSLYLIDQHAAHERVLYETFLAELKSESVVSQRLLQPEIIKISPLESETIQKYKNTLEKFGFDFSEAPDNEMVVNAVPCLFGKPMQAVFFLDAVDMFMQAPNEENTLYEIKLENIASKACKAAVKAHDKLDYTEAMALIEMILDIENPFTCPHGRPTIIEISKLELEKMFKRV